MPINNVVNEINKANQYLNTTRDVIDAVNNVSNSVKSIFNKTVGATKPGGSTSSVIFERPAGSRGSISANGKEVSGSSTELMTTVPDAYMVIIENNQWQVKSIMQDVISLRTSSEWEPFVNMSGLSSLANTTFQAITKRSLMTRMTSRRIWKGTSPIEIQLALRFEAIQNAANEVVRPCLRLKQMSAPAEGTEKFFGIPLLSPPGPSPFKITDNKPSDDVIGKAVKHFEEGDNISIGIGTFMFFDNVIIKDVQVDYASRLNQDGMPISATANVVFQTYEILTKGKLQSVYPRI